MAARSSAITSRPGFRKEPGLLLLGVEIHQVDLVRHHLVEVFQSDQSACVMKPSVTGTKHKPSSRV